MSPVPREFAGLKLDRPLLMGIVNVTPDSFSDGGAFFDAERAIRHGRHLIAEGADILDIGGESTRPGATPVEPEEEKRRVLPVIEGLSDAGVPLSCDTSKPEVMAAALDAGARIINDVRALRLGGIDLIAARGAAVILGHMQGEPATMNVEPHYADVVAEVRAFLAERVAACIVAGIPPERIAVDPGFGFGKRRRHNMALLHDLGALAAFDVTICVGASRKFSPKDATEEMKLAGSLIAAVVAVRNGARILRVHDVAEHKAALELLPDLAPPGQEAQPSHA
ncbi:MAG TPA: dihydropteroate synthase [Alphaproteobacteria bacterium]|jgi:dihydropteroate synthase